MAIRSTERALGDRWVEVREGLGAWIVKVPASTTAGFPDWLVLNVGIELWEAKRIGTGKTAYDPKQLSGAQRFFVRMMARYLSPDYPSGVLLLGEDGFLEIRSKRALRPMSAKAFHRNKEPYNE